MPPPCAADLLGICVLDFAVNEAARTGAMRRIRSGQMIAAHFSHYTEILAEQRYAVNEENVVMH
jgi:hypothetical protein